MINIVELVKDLYVVYKNNERITPIPLTKSELTDFLISIPLTESEQEYIERFYGDVS